MRNNKGMPSSKLPVQVLYLDGTPVRPEQPAPTLRRTASGRLFVYKAARSPTSSPTTTSCSSDNTSTSVKEMDLMDAFHILNPQIRPFADERDLFCINQVSVHKANVVDPPPPKLSVRRKQTTEAGSLRRQGRLHVESEGLYRWSWAAVVDGEK